MHIVEGACRLTDDVLRLCLSEMARRDGFVKVSARHDLLHDVERVVILADVKHAHDVGVVSLAENL